MIKHVGHLKASCNFFELPAKSFLGGICLNLKAHEESAGVQRGVLLALGDVATNFDHRSGNRMHDTFLVRAYKR